MANSLVVDVSVVIAAVSPSETRHHESLQFMQAVHRRHIAIEAPAHFLLELYAVLNRSPRELQQLGFMTAHDPVTIRLVAIGEIEVEKTLAWVSSTFPGKSPTKGADLAYAWVARQSRLPLVTNDNGLHQFKNAGIDVYYPAEFMTTFIDSRVN